MPAGILGIRRIAMAAIAQALSRVLVIVSDAEVLKQLAMFCGAGLLVSLLADLGPRPQPGLLLAP
jgi:hypothetical protein